MSIEVGFDVSIENAGMNPSSFSIFANFGNYRQILREFKAKNYTPVSFSEFDPLQTHLLLRHDVDISLTHAVKLAQVDAEEGFKSTIFVMVSSHLYNTSTKLSRSQLSDMLGMGHEIGLHFDPAVYGKDANLEAAARLECDQLENILGREVTVTAAHRPGVACPYFLGMPGHFADRLHAYAPAFFHETTYLSDSVGYWSHGNPLAHPTFKNSKAMHLLMHPYLWTSSGGTLSDKISRILDEHSGALTSAAKDNFRHYQTP